MTEQASDLKIELGKQKVLGNPVYAVNKSGDFSTVSVREKDWPSNAEEKQDPKELNENNSNGAKRFENVVARVIQLGDIPRGAQYNSPRASNDGRDSDMGVIALPISDLQEKYEERMKDLGDLLLQASNPKTSLPWPKGYKVMRMEDMNAPKALPKTPKGGKEVFVSTETNKAIETADAVPSVIQKGKPMIQITAPKNEELKVI